jgi:hypothetical protein
LNSWTIAAHFPNLTEGIGYSFIAGTDRKGNNDSSPENSFTLDRKLDINL